jgi:flagellar basal body-associated protein FliL
MEKTAKKMNETSPTRPKRIIFFVLIGIVLLVLIGVILIFVFSSRPAPEPVTFRNPLNESHGSDPWMVYYKGKYYLAATTWSP